MLSILLVLVFVSKARMLFSPRASRSRSLKVVVLVVVVVVVVLVVLETAKRFQIGIVTVTVDL